MDCETSETKENNLPSDFVPPPTPLLKRIGYGTGVSVYHLDRSPHNHTIRSPWALKKVNRQHEASQFQDRLVSEAKILQELKHPNIVGFRGFSKTDDGRQVLAMEVCNESLGNLIEESAENGETRFQPDKILTVIAGIAKGLQYLHEEKELLHGDIKSHNVLIKGNFEEIKLCDFGVSLPLRTASVEDYVGTGAWSAPETLDEGPLTDRADIFSLGLMIWEMLTLRTPNVDVSESVSFSDSFDSINIGQHYGETPELPGDLTSDYNLVVDIYQWCTQQLYTRRPTARDILDKLREAGIPLNMSPPQITL
uniref:Protein kinase domain-containing protein n=1 Tax=Homalodisca liturata TaxID=320908 RepID=A0A1B6HCD9_9HEMI